MGSSLVANNQTVTPTDTSLLTTDGSSKRTTSESKVVLIRKSK